MYAQDRKALRPIDLCVLKAERKRARAEGRLRNTSTLSQFAATAALIGLLLCVAILIPLAAVAGSSVSSEIWFICALLIGVAALVFGGILAGDTCFDLEESTTAADRSAQKPAVSQAVERHRRDQAESADTVHTVA